MDKPFIIGDWIKTPTNEGTVEDITFRSTRLRNFENLEIVIPNSTLVNSSIINYSRIQKRRIIIEFYINLNTSRIEIEKLIERIKIVIENTENVIKGTVFVNWEEVNEKGIKVYIYLYTNKVKSDDYLKVKTNLHLQILQILENQNLKLSYPGIYIDNQMESVEENKNM